MNEENGAFGAAGLHHRFCPRAVIFSFLLPSVPLDSSSIVTSSTRRASAGHCRRVRRQENNKKKGRTRKKKMVPSVPPDSITASVSARS